MCVFNVVVFWEVSWSFVNLWCIVFVPVFQCEWEEINNISCCFLGGWKEFVILCLRVFCVFVCVCVSGFVSVFVSVCMPVFKCICVYFLNVT